MRPVATSGQVQPDHDGRTPKAVPIACLHLPFQNADVNVRRADFVVTAGDLRFKLCNLLRVAGTEHGARLHFDVGPLRGHPQ